VLPDVKAHPDNPTFTVVAIYDPRYAEPWLLACPLRLTGAALHGLYRDRWAVEQVPLTAKQMVGAARQFVFAPQSQQRLPMLALLAGAMLTYLAATLPATPTGFWDRQPQPTAGRLRRLLARTPFPETYPWPEPIRKKASVVAHLLKGILGHLVVPIFSGDYGGKKQQPLLENGSVTGSPFALASPRDDSSLLGALAVTWAMRLPSLI
jgi:hypothetical protein